MSSASKDDQPRKMSLFYEASRGLSHVVVPDGHRLIEAFFFILSQLMVAVYRTQLGKPIIAVGGHIEFDRPHFLFFLRSESVLADLHDPRGELLGSIESGQRDFVVPGEVDDRTVETVVPTPALFVFRQSEKYVLRDLPVDVPVDIALKWLLKHLHSHT